MGCSVKRNGEKGKHTMGSKKASQEASQKTRSAYSEKAGSEASYEGSQLITFGQPKPKKRRTWSKKSKLTPKRMRLIGGQNGKTVYVLTELEAKDGILRYEAHRNSGGVRTESTRG